MRLFRTCCEDYNIILSVVVFGNITKEQKNNTDLIINEMH